MKVKDLELTDQEFHYLIISIAEFSRNVIDEDEEVLTWERKREILDVLRGLQLKFINEQGRNHEH